MLMRMREKKYSDYWLFDDDLEQIKLYCTDPPPERQEIIMDAAMLANPCIAQQLYNSLVHKQSYATQVCKTYIPYDEKDFYAYRRKAMYYLYQFMRFGLTH